MQMVRIVIFVKNYLLPEFHAAKDLYDPNTGQYIGQTHRKCLFEELAEFIGPRAKPRGNTINPKRHKGEVSLTPPPLDFFGLKVLFLDRLSKALAKLFFVC